jgi:hypothetical protein
MLGFAAILTNITPDFPGAGSDGDIHREPDATIVRDRNLRSVSER